MLANVEYHCYACKTQKIILQVLRHKPTLICEKCHEEMRQGLTGIANLKSADFSLLP